MKHYQIFFGSNNIEESLDQKTSYYLPRKKIINSNFIIAMRNIILIYEAKKENIIRKDFVSKTLLEHIKPFKLNKYKRLDYNLFIKLENNIIKKSGYNLDSKRYWKSTSSN